MSEPDTGFPTSSSHALERSTDETLQAVQPLSWDDEMIIEGLTEDEETLFVEAIRDA